MTNISYLGTKIKYAEVDDGEFIKRAVAGLAATLPMSLSMEALYLLLRSRLGQSLPPAVITMKVTEILGINRLLSRKQKDVLILLSHFSYGAVVGAVASFFSQRIRVRPLNQGLLLGSAVWFGSYVVWLPAARLMPPVTKQSREMTALLLSTHFIWGWATIWLANRLLSNQDHEINASEE